MPRLDDTPDLLAELLPWAVLAVRNAAGRPEAIANRDDPARVMLRRIRAGVFGDPGQLLEPYEPERRARRRRSTPG